MPWRVAHSDTCPTKRPWAVILQSDNSVVACHTTEKDAHRQLAALYANENGKAVGPTADGEVKDRAKRFDPHQRRDPHTGEWADGPGGGGEIAEATDALQALLPEGTKISRLDVPQSEGHVANRLVLHRPGYDDPHEWDNGVHNYTPGEGQHIGRLTWRSDTGEIEIVFVAPEYRRRGIATAMLRLARAQAKAEGTARPKHSDNQEPEGAAWARVAKRFDPHQLRDPHTGEWADSPGGGIGNPPPIEFDESMGEGARAATQAAVEAISRALPGLLPDRVRVVPLGADEDWEVGGRSLANGTIALASDQKDNASARSAVVHELAHAWDRAHGKEGDEWATQSPELSDVFWKTPTVEKIKRGDSPLIADNERGYYSQSREAFARAVEQLVGLQGGDEKIKREIDSARSNEQGLADQYFTDEEWPALEAAIRKAVEGKPKAFNPHQPRDPHTGQWVDIPGRGYGLFDTIRGPSGGQVAAPRRGSGGRDLPDIGGDVFSSPSLTPRTYAEWQESQRRQRERLGDRARRVAFADPRTVAPHEQVNVRARDVFVKAAADRAFGSIEGVHGYGPPLPEEPLAEITTNSQMSSAADFDYYSREIRVNARRLSHADTPVVGQVPESPTEKSTAQGAFYITHELGHALDRALGGSYGWLSAEEDNAASRVLGAAEESEAIGRIRRDADLSVSPLRSYLLDRAEIFARAYAQYIALRSGDQAQQQEVADLAGYTNEPIWQWGEQDFEPIAQAFDEMFEELGWT